MSRFLLLLVLALSLAGSAVAQTDRDAEAGVSSSRDTKIDISPPKDDAKNHPNSGAAVTDAEAKIADESEDTGDVQEMHPFDPHRAAKDIEVGDYYFKLKDYRGALSRYREALLYKPDDAIANFRLGECLAKMDRPDEAVLHYQAYLKILPEGPLSKDAHKALERLNRGRPDGSKPNGSETNKAKPDQQKVFGAEPSQP
jgi:tetratricopeptide (TPR) repeat protein